MVTFGQIFMDFRQKEIIPDRCIEIILVLSNFWSGAKIWSAIRSATIPLFSLVVTSRDFMKWKCGYQKSAAVIKSRQPIDQLKLSSNHFRLF